MALIKREQHEHQPEPEPLDIFSRFNKMFDEWTRNWPQSMFQGMPWVGEDIIKVDELRHDSTLIIRAELPGIDPDKDVNLSVSDDALHITARRRVEEESDDQGYYRRELRYGTFKRTLMLPKGVTESDITASYKDGILEIRITLPETVLKPDAKQIPISRG